MNAIRPTLGAMLDGVEPPPSSATRAYVMHAAAWHTGTAWPTEDGRRVDLYCTAEGALVDQAPAVEGTLVFDYVPSAPRMSRGGTVLGQGVGPAWQSHDDHRTDQVVFESVAMAAPLDMLGPLGATLFVGSRLLDAPSGAAPASTDFVVCLQDLYPDGRLLNIQEGAATVDFGGATEPRQVDVDCWATGYRLLPGHRLRLVVTSSCFPRFARNLNGGEPLATAVTSRSVRQTVLVGGATASRVTLTVVPTGEGR